ncbi:ribonuclease III [Nisaea acidiphila]|uniref:Ribonuclease 3 n=1 Tax=Nisaea acidiphila TaxID=1862145 RepID=A0A9J7ATB5_9PROT|nr:ribonuclease III [Nisaea acidiphila]UUX50414.1 ribonuclease III [Nisaea acidiphila]
MDSDLEDLEELLGHKFGHTDVLRRAVTHASAEPRAWNAYERLEFLGDRVLALVMAEHLLDRFPHEREGAIAKRHVGLVRREALAEVARQIGLGRFLIVSRGETEAGVRESETILSDAMEAVIGALYLDGGLGAAQRFILQCWNPLVEADLRPPQDAKTTLQEWVQARKIPLPTYETIGRDGPAHAPEFTVRVSVQGHGAQTGTGKSKRIAEQDAAGKMIAKLND